MGKTNPTSTLTAREFVAIEQPQLLDGLDDFGLSQVLAEVERRGFALAQRLGVDGKTDRLPAFIWSIIFSLK